MKTPNKTERIALAILIWTAYNNAERKMTGYHEPHLTLQEGILTILLGLSLTAQNKAVQKGTDFQTEMKPNLKKLEKGIKEAYDKLSKAETTITTGIIQDAVKEAGKALDDAMRVVVEGYQINVDMLSENIWNKNTAMFRKMVDNITVAIAEGKSVNSMVLEIQKVVGTSEYNAYRLARTETMKYLNERLLETFHKADVKYVREVVVVDERTSEECLGHVDMIHPIDEAPTLPRRPNCRCTYEAIRLTEDGRYVRF